MKKNISIIISLIFLLSTIACKENSINEKPTQINIDKKIENWLVKTGIPSTSITFFKNGKIITSKTYGYSNLKTI